MTRSPRIIAGAATLAMTCSLIIASSGSPAQAVDGSQWDPGNIVSDQQFYNSDAMTQPQIQAFLDAKVPTCHPELSTGPDDPIVCLKDYRQDTVTRPADAYCTGTYQGASNELASTIIAKVSAACNISAKAILATLQKETGLVTHVDPSPWRYKTAMGYGCSDTSACETQYYGFQNQVWRAARQFQLYRAFPNSYGHRAGINNFIQYKPNSTCGTQTVFIQNSATAGLYNYTPYVPNAAAIAAGYGLGDTCSSYGNRNFWRYWWDWFGDPHAALVNVASEQRIAGGNRYATAAALSAGIAPGANVVYVASGENYPDALAVAPIAASVGAALLLVRHDGVPDEIAAELRRLQPTRIVVVGGTGAIDNTVYDKLATYAGSGGITRLGGADRYETARLTIGSFWSNGSASTVYVASGQNFPDALSAVAAAGARGIPVVTLDGSAPHLDAATATLIASLGATEVVVAGGNGAVTDGIFTDLAGVAGVATVRRVAGADRYATSAAINSDAFTRTGSVYFASGEDFPDALAGAVRAGADKAPLYLLPGTCVPRVIADSVNRFGPINATIIGGTGVMPLNLVTAPIC